MKNSTGLLFAAVGFIAVGYQFESLTTVLFGGLCFGLGYVRAWKGEE